MTSPDLVVTAPPRIADDPRGARASIDVMLAQRSSASTRFFTTESDRIALLSSRMASRFAAGGRLLAIGLSPASRSDARHVAVEFVHPVIVGKRALPAIALTGNAADVTRHFGLIVSPSDIVLTFGDEDGDDEEGACLSSAVASARAAECLTIAVDGVGAEFAFRAPVADPFVWQEIVETLYHVLWETVHVFFEHGLEIADATSDPGRAGFLYPFLRNAPRDLTAVTQDVARSVLDKARETDALRARTLLAGRDSGVAHAAAAIRERLDVGATVLAFGNGGSATDAMDLVADLRSPPRALGLMSRRALDLTEDTSILTALANDVGPDLVFARQIIAYGRPGDVAIAFSTSGTSRNVVAGLAAARRQGLATVAFTGYDGGSIAADKLADYVIIAPSEYVPRIQEAHATAYHIMRTVIG